MKIISLYVESPDVIKCDNPQILAMTAVVIDTNKIDNVDYPTLELRGILDDFKAPVRYITQHAGLLADLDTYHSTKKTIDILYNSDDDVDIDEDLINLMEKFTNPSNMLGKLRSFLLEHGVMMEGEHRAIFTGVDSRDALEMLASVTDVPQSVKHRMKFDSFLRYGGNIDPRQWFIRSSDVSIPSIEECLERAGINNDYVSIYDKALASAQLTHALLGNMHYLESTITENGMDITGDLQIQISAPDKEKALEVTKTSRNVNGDKDTVIVTTEDSVRYIPSDKKVYYLRVQLIGAKERLAKIDNEVGAGGIIFSNGLAKWESAAGYDIIPTGTGYIVPFYANSHAQLFHDFVKFYSNSPANKVAVTIYTKQEEVLLCEHIELGYVNPYDTTGDCTKEVVLYSRDKKFNFSDIIPIIKENNDIVGIMDNGNNILCRMLSASTPERLILAIQPDQFYNVSQIANDFISWSILRISDDVQLHVPFPAIEESVVLVNGMTVAGIEEEYAENVKAYYNVTFPRPEDKQTINEVSQIIKVTNDININIPRYTDLVPYISKESEKLQREKLSKQYGDAVSSSMILKSYREEYFELRTGLSVTDPNFVYAFNEWYAEAFMNFAHEHQGTQADFHEFLSKNVI